MCQIGCLLSRCFGLIIGVRQGGILSPYLYIDSVVQTVSDSKFGCYVNGACILLYADDILLLSPSVSCLQEHLLLCEQELKWLDMLVNAKKSSCLRIGTRFNSHCCNIVNSEGSGLLWVKEICYLRIYIESAASLNVLLHM